MRRIERGRWGHQPGTSAARAQVVPGLGRLGRDAEPRSNAYPTSGGAP